jgi:hypothetical protein
MKWKAAAGDDDDDESIRTSGHNAEHINSETDSSV